MSGDLLLRAEDICKTYPGTRALDGVDLDVRAGEVHALLGGNGSGKSTFVKVLAGVETADAGTYNVGGQVTRAERMTPPRARALGIRFVHQDAGIFPDRTVAENLALGRGFETGLLGRVRWAQLADRARRDLARVGLVAEPHRLLSSLSPAGQTMVAIARALGDVALGDRALLVLDEPTAALPSDEAERLLEMVRRLTDGGLGVLLITHRLDEVVRHADRVTVFRDGRGIGTVERSELTVDTLVELIVGRALGEVSASSGPTAAAEVSLRVRGLVAGPLKGIDLDVHRGEILGVAGILGSGRSTLLRSLYGLQRRDSGAVHLDGRAIHKTADAIRSGIGYVPENRGADGIFPNLSVTDNLLLASTTDFVRGLGVSRTSERREAGRLVEHLGVRARDIASPISSLSGGNQQKVVMGRWLRRTLRVLLLDEPTQGVDVGARADIYRLVRAAADQGTSVVLVASDLDELSAVADRIVVLSDGAIAHQLHAPGIDHATVTELTLRRKAPAR